MRPEDVDACAAILYQAFFEIAQQHSFEPDFPTPDFPKMIVASMVDSPEHFAVVAEGEGRILGSNFLSELGPIRAVGPLSVEPGLQGRQVGRQLMEAVMERGREAPGIRLVQDSFNSASLSLYAKLGFEVQEPLALMAGVLSSQPRPDTIVRPLQETDLKDCAELCRRVHGWSREGEIKALPPFVQPLVALREGRITAYCSAPSFWPLNHGMAETDWDLQDLLAGFGDTLSFLLPIRQASLFKWCLKSGLRVQKTMNLMSLGEYRQPQGAWFPSVGH